MTSKTSLALASAAALVAASVAAAGEPQASTRTQTRTAYKYVVTDGDHAPAAGDAHQVMVTSRAVDGADPSLQVRVLGEGMDAETMDVGSLEPGESRTFTTKDGKEVVVTRSETGVNLSIDGKDIELPSLMNVSVLPGEGGTAIAVAGADGQLHSEDANVFVVGGPHVMMAGPGAASMNFDDLESLKGLDPEVRDKVVAALHEILSSPGGLAQAFAITLPEGAVAAAPGAPGAPRVIVRRQVVKTDDDEAHSNMQ